MVKLKPLNAQGAEGILNGTSTPAIAIAGNIGRGTGYGFARRGNAAYGETPNAGGIYQRRYTGYNQHGYIPGKKRKPYYVRMRFYRPTNPRTELQQAGRGKFAEAVAAWQSLTESDKKYYNDRGKRKSRRGRNVFIQEYMRKP